MGTDLTNWALPRISRILPIDDESLKEVIKYSASLSKEAGAENLKNLLGDSPQALEFISSFNSRRPNVAPGNTFPTASPDQSSAQTSRTDDEGVPAPRRKIPKKGKAPLHHAGPVRRPEGYGDLTGGYKKPTYDEQSYLGTSSNQGGSVSSVTESRALSQQPAAVQLPTATAKLKVDSPSPTPSRDPSPPRQRLPPSASGHLISDLPNVRAKQSRKPLHSGTSSPNKPNTLTTSSISDLTAAIAALELSTNPSLSSERRKCPCNASIHPLFATAPNCLSCGKIICALEGLQPCSFCDSPILTKEQVNSMIRALKEERGQERMAVHNAGASHSGRGTPNFGGVGGTTPESSGDEASGAASRARAHRDRLLAFQRENAQRTKIYDEAADYDMTLTPGASHWMSPVQRATALKKQQKYLRELEEQSKPEYERKKTVMSMSIKNGKLVKTYEKVQTPRPDATEADTVEEDGSDDALGGEGPSSTAKGGVSSNPLLASGKLIRPVWKAREGDMNKDGSEGEGQATRKSVWRKVQDDDEDNEQWILDGGIYGFAAEDGSKQECG